jgi:hypothetical protein
MKSSALSHDHLHINELLFKHQHGFLQVIVSFVNMGLSTSDMGLETRSVFLDIAGAVYAVPNILLSKQQQSGLIERAGNCGKWRNII